MIRKRAIVVAAGSVLMLAVMSGLALSHGFGGHGKGDHSMFLLARAAGVTHDQIASAFQNSNLKNDRANLKTTHDAVMSCLLSPPSQGTGGSTACSSQIASFANAVQTMAQDRMTVWQNLFKTAPTLSQAASVYSQMQQLHAQQKQMFQSVFGSQGTGDSTASPND
jgi:hypothetical protein